MGHDHETLAFYDREAPVYAARARGGDHPHLSEFLACLAPGARILELGCGGGQDAKVMLDAGFDVVPTDGSTGLAAEAERLLGRPVHILLFEDLAEGEAYDAVWANACLLHVPEDSLADVLARIHRALKPGGLFRASYKSGQGGDRDGLGRYYNFPTRESLAAAYTAAGAWATTEFCETDGGGYDGVPRTWLIATARR